MKRLFTTTSLLAILLIWGDAQTSIAQERKLLPKNGMNAQPNNYKWFTPKHIDKDAATIENNAGYENHPEIGMLYAETPCDNCYEMIGDRTEMTKTYVKKGPKSKDGGKDIYTQTSSLPMHYRDEKGNWRTIKTHLEPDNTAKGVFSAFEQEVPVSVNTVNKFSSLGKKGESLQFNHDLELLFAKPDGTQLSLGNADWSNYTAGDDGVYVTNAWPGIDVEMYVIRGAVKTNFIINHAMPQYAAGQLLVRDHLLMENGLSLHGNNGNKRYAGNLEVRNAAGKDIYDISFATVYEKNNVKKTVQTLDYLINGNDLDIVLPGDFLDRSAKSYPVVIDPLVSTATVVPVTGSTYSAVWTVPCAYPNAATVPANCTVTDIQWTFNYITTGGAWLNEGAVDFRLGACRSPTGPTGPGGFYWFCNVVGAGTCTGLNISIFADISACVPAPQCAPYNLNMTMDFYQRYLATAPCASTYVYGGTPLTITVIGHTVEINPVVVSGATVICAGQSTTLSTSALYGVPPYTFSWTPGPIAGTPVTVSPLVTTTYTATVTDACGITSTATQTITVNPIPPITGTTSVCVGGTTTLSNATAGGTWTSGTTTVATIDPTTGVVSGVAVGATTIVYTTIAGCSTTITVNVNLLSPITGIPSACVGNTSALANAFAGGAWSSSNTAIASVDATTGLVTAVAPGTATISYLTGAGCSTTVIFTVNPLPAAIGGPTSVCIGSTITLTDASLAGAWSTLTGAIAAVNSSGVVTGVSTGNSIITYTLPTGCYITTTIAVHPTFSTNFNATICQGATYTFGGSGYTTTGVYPHLFTSVYGCDSLATLHLTVIPTTYTTIYDSICAGGTYIFAGGSCTLAGAYTHLFFNINGCDSNVTLNLFVKPLPPAPLTSDIDYCQNGLAASLTASGSNLLWYTLASGGIGNPTAPTPSTITPGVFTYYVSQRVSGCEGARAPINITVHIQAPFVIAPAKPYECQFDTIGLYYSGPTYAGINYQWTVPAHSTITSGLPTDPAIVVRFDTSLGGDIVTLTVGDGYTACDVTKTFSVPVFLTAPPAYFNVNHDVCAGDSVLIALSYVGTGINDFLWNFDGGNVVVHNSNHGGPYKVVWATPGIYVVTLNAVTNPNCPTSQVQDTVRVHDYPNSLIAPFVTIGNGAKVCQGDSILFSPLHFDNKNYYFWTPSHYFNETNRDHIIGRVDNPGYIKMTVSTPFGCTSKDSIYVNAEPCCTIAFPTAFTPNNDGKNDLFHPITIGNHEIHFFRVVNRWGQTVYESRNEHYFAWDGTFNGEPQDMGVYYFFISYVCGKEDNMIEKGEVTLVR